MMVALPLQLQVSLHSVESAEACARDGSRWGEHGAEAEAEAEAEGGGGRGQTVRRRERLGRRGRLDQKVLLVS